MAHNLETRNGKTSFVSIGKAWHNLGQTVESAMTAEQAIGLANLDYEVIKVPTYLKHKEEEIITGHYSTLRTDTKEVLGQVGSVYTVLQNRDAFKFFDNLIEKDEAVFETAGVLGIGERIFLTAKMPAHIKVGKDDLVDMYVVLTNSHDGRSYTMAMITPIRVVCNNTLTRAIKQNKCKVTIKHTSSIEAQLKQAHEVLGLSNILAEQLKESYNFLQGIKITDAKAIEKFKQFLEVTDEKISTRKQNQLEALQEYYFTGVGQESIVGTGWGLYNAFTGYNQHVKSYHNDSNKLSVILDTVDDPKLFNLILN